MVKYEIKYGEAGGFPKSIRADYFEVDGECVVFYKHNNDGPVRSRRSDATPVLALRGNWIRVKKA